MEAPIMPDTTNDTQIYHCPCCGQEMAILVQRIEYKHINRTFVNVTCWQEGCVFATYTMSPDQANDGEILTTKYGFTKRYDVYNGELVP